MSLPDFLAALIIFTLLPLLAVWSVMLVRRSRARRMLKVLRSNALMAAWLTVLVAIHAVVYLNNGMDEPILGPYQTMVLTRSVIYSLVIPVGNWVWIYRPRRG